MLKKLSLIILSVVSAYAMHSGEININNKDLEIGAKFDLGQFNPAVEPDTMFIGGKFINADGDHAENYLGNKVNDLDPYLELNFLMMQAVGDQGMSIGMGAKLNFTENYSAVPLGLEFTYKLPVVDFVPMYLNGSLYYAPSVLCMRDADSFLEYRLSYDAEVIKNGYITIGYRNIDTNWGFFTIPTPKFYSGNNDIKLGAYYLSTGDYEFDVISKPIVIDIVTTSGYGLTLSDDEIIQGESIIINYRCTI